MAPHSAPTPPPIYKPVDTTSLRQVPYFTRSVVLSTLFGALSLGYLGITLAAPDWLDDVTPAVTTNDPTSNQGQRAAARLAADVDGLKEQLNQLQLELARVKTEMTQSATVTQTMAGDIAALRQRIETAQATVPATTASAVPMKPAAAPVAAAAPAANSQTSDAAPGVTTVKAKTSSAAPAVPSIINGGVTVSSLETGSVSTAKASTDAISFGPAVVKPAPKPLGLRISSAASVDSLRLSWSMLSEKHNDVLKNLEPRVTTNTIGGEETFNLVAGPVKSKAEALRVCKSLAAKGVACEVRDFAGSAL